MPNFSDPARVDFLVNGKTVSWAPISSFWQIHLMLGGCYLNLRELGHEVEIRVRDSRDATIPVMWWVDAEGGLHVEREI